MSFWQRLFGDPPPTVQSVVGVPEFDGNGSPLPRQPGWFQEEPGEVSRFIRTTPPPAEEADLWYQDGQVYAPIESKPDLGNDQVYMWEVCTDDDFD